MAELYHGLDRPFSNSLLLTSFFSFFFFFSLFSLNFINFSHHHLINRYQSLIPIFSSFFFLPFSHLHFFLPLINIFSSHLFPLFLLISLSSSLIMVFSSSAFFHLFLHYHYNDLISSSSFLPSFLSSSFPFNPLLKRNEAKDERETREEKR